MSLPAPRREGAAPRPWIPVPRPLEEAEEVLSTAPEIRSLLAHRVFYYLVHNIRCYGHTPLFLYHLWRHPRTLFKACLLYWGVLRRTNWWNRTIHRAIQLGSSREQRFVRARRQPYDTQRQYLISTHPHGVLLCPWFGWLGREEVPSTTDFSDKGFSTRLRAMDGLAVTLCFAPAVQFMALHGEMYRDRVTDVKSTTVRSILQRSRDAPVKETVALCPGGFSESCFVSCSDKYEVSYISDRVGFVKIAVEEGVDIIPTYSFGANDMYKSLDWRRQDRAKWAQATGIPMTLWYGQYGTNVPYSEDVVTVCFDPFPASQYAPSEVKQAHADYCAYLKLCFDAYKGCCPATKDKELIFMGTRTPLRAGLAGVHARL